MEIARQTAVGFTKIWLFALLVGAVPFSSYGQTNPQASAPQTKRHKLGPVNPKLFGPSVAQELDGGVWRTDGGFQATFRISNKINSAAIKVTPVLFMADGAEFVLPAVDIKASGSATVNINDALSKAPRDIAAHVSNFGSATLRFNWPWPQAINASLRSLDAKRSLTFSNILQPSLDSDVAFRKSQLSVRRKNTVAEQKLARDMSRQSMSIEGLWWKRDPDTGGFITLTNRSQEQIPVQISISSTDKKGDFNTHALLLPHQTQRIDLQTAFRDLPRASQNGAINIRYQGVKSSILVTGGMENATMGYSAKIPFGYTPGESHSISWTVASVGIMHGAPDPMMQFPAKTSFQAYAVLRNTSAQPLQITPTLYFTPGREAKTPQTPEQTLTAPQLVLSPGEIRNLDLEGLLAGSGLKDTGGNLTLSLNMNGVAGALLAAIGSVDQSGSYVFEVSPHLVSSSLGKSICFFEVGNGDDTMVSLWNHSDQPEDLLATLFYNDGHYTLPLHLAPKQSAMFNVLEIIKAQSPDADGNVIPLSTRHGSISISGPEDLTDRIEVTVNSATFNVRQATCDEGCVICPGYSRVTMDETDTTLPLGSFTTVSATGIWENSGGGQLQAAWTSTNPYVADVDWNGGVTITGVGQALIYADLTLPFYSVACEYDIPPTECPVVDVVELGCMMTGTLVVHGLISPVSDFANRSYNRFGVGEQVDLLFSSEPPMTAAQLGGVRWSKVSGVGTLTGADLTGTPGDDGTAKYLAPYTPGTVTLKLEVLSGIVQPGTLTFTIVAPSGGHIVENPAKPRYHINNLASAGFKAFVYLEPKDVSFAYIRFREGEAPLQPDGYLTTSNVPNHPQGPDVTVGACNITTGCQASFDVICTGPILPKTGTSSTYDFGTATWRIPWTYGFSSTGPFMDFANSFQAVQVAQITPDGSLTVQKLDSAPVTISPLAPSSPVPTPNTCDDYARLQ